MAKPLPKTMAKSTRLKILRRARHLLENGFAQGTWKTAKDPWTSLEAKDYDYCVEGACNQAAIELGYDVWIDSPYVTQAVSINDLSRAKYNGRARAVNDSDRPDKAKKKVLGLIDQKIKDYEGA